MADLSKITCPDGTTVDILSKTTRGIVRGVMNNSSSTSTSFVISAPGIDSLYDGATFICKNTKVASADGCVMDVNGLGAKGMWCSQSNTAVTTHWTKNYTYIWVYDATNERWEFYQGRDTDGNDIQTIRPGYTRIKAGVNGIKAYSFFARTTNLNEFSSFFTNDGGTGAKTFDTSTSFDFSKIYLSNISTDIASGSVLSNNGMSFSYPLHNMRYDFTGVTTSAATSTLVAEKPVYLIFSTNGCSPGYGKLVSPCITQNPSAAGLDDYHKYIYVLVGWMHDSYRMDFLINNPAYKIDKRFVNGQWVEAYRLYTEGCETANTGNYSHAEGLHTTAYGECQHVFGKYNLSDFNDTYIEIVGNGAEDDFSNARTLDWDGNESISGTYSCYDSSYINNSTINAKSSTNGVSQTGEYISNIFVEKNGYQIGRVGVDAVDTGRIGVNMSSTNYNSSGTEMVSNSLILNSYKDGTASVAISHPDKWRDSLGLTNNQVANDGYVLKTGNIYCTSPATDISSIANNTNTATGTLKFPAGLYILIYYCRFGYASGSGYRYISINNSNAAGSYGILNQASMAGFSGTDAHMQLVSFLKFSSETSIYLRAYQNSGSTLSLAPRYNVIKLY